MNRRRHATAVVKSRASDVALTSRQFTSTGFRRLTMRTSCLVFVALLLVAPRAMAQTISPAPDPIVIGTGQELLLPSLVDLARRHAEASPWRASRYDPIDTTQQPVTGTTRPNRKRGLILAVGGVAAIATGAYL